MSTYEKYIHEWVAQHGLTETEADAFARHVTGLAFDKAIDATGQLLLSAMVSKGSDLKPYAARLTGQTSFEAWA